MLEAIENFIFGKEREISQGDLNRMTQRNRFHVYLPWEAYDPETKTYHNSDDTIGFLWECTPLAFAGEQTISTLEGLFRLGIPFGSILQFILYSDKYIEDYVDAYRDGKKRNHPIVKEATERFSRYILDGVKGMEIFQRTPIRDFRLYVALKIPKAEVDKVNLKDLYSTVRECLFGAHLQPEPVEPSRLVDWMRKVLNDSPSLNNNHYDEEIPIKKQVILSDTAIEKSMAQIKIGNRFFRCTTVKNFPSEISTWQTNELFGGVWGITSDANQIITPFLYSLNVIFQDLKMSLHMKCNFVLQQQAAGSFAPSLMRKKEEYMWATDNLEKGVSFVKIIPTLWVWSEDEKLATESIVRVKRMWEGQGYVMQEDKGILPPLLISSLPFGLYNRHRNIENLDRDFIAPAGTVASLLPVQADFGGGGYPQVILIGRKGQWVRLDLYGKAANNFNLFIAAAPGTGKSFAANNLILNHFASNGIVRIIDAGDSYKKMCKILGGNYLDFDFSSNISMNPFTHIGVGLKAEDNPEEEVKHEISAVGHLVYAMVYASTEDAPQESALERDIIHNAVQRAWKEYGNGAEMDAVYSKLMSFPDKSDTAFEHYSEDQKVSFRNTAQRLAFSLRAFTSQGNYGKWFNGQSTFNISSDEFVVLEIDKLKPMRELFKVITLQVINAVAQDLYLSDRDRDRERLILFDEAWQYMKEGNSLKGIIEEGYRKARKYRGSFSIITQSVLDLLLFGSVGTVIKSSSEWKIFLASSDFEKAKKDNLIDYDEFSMQLLKSIRTLKGKYSEMFIDGPYGRGVARLAVDPFSYYVFTSDAAEFSEIEKMVAGGMNYAEAIQEMVRKYRS